MSDTLKCGKILPTDMICRICLTHRNDTISIFRKFVVESECHISPKTSQIMSVLELLEYFTQIQMYEKFSSMVCKICIKNAYDAFIFKTKIRKTEAWLQSYIPKLKILTSSEKNHVYNKSGNTSDKTSLASEDLQTIKDWLESQISELETSQSKIKKCDSFNLENKIDLQVDLTTDCQDLEKTSKSVSSQLNKKCVTIIKRKKRKTGTIQHSNAPILKRNLSKENTNITMQGNPSLQNRIDTHLNKKCEVLKNNDPKLEKNSSKNDGFTLENKIDLQEECQLIDLTTNCQDLEETSKNVTIVKTKLKPDAPKLKIKLSEESLKSKIQENLNLQDRNDYQVIKNSTKVENILISKPSSKKDSNLKNKCDVNTDKNVINVLPDSLREHDYNSIFCEVCNAYFPGKFPYEEHKKVHTARNYKCKFCTKKFKTSSYLKTHLKTHSKDESFDQVLAQYTLDINYPVYMNSKLEKFFMCELCAVVYKLFRCLTNHMKSTHVKDDKKYCCNICAEVFYERPDLVSHLQLHGLPYLCAHCPEKFSIMMDLNNHVKTHSSGAPLLIPYDPKLLKDRKDHVRGDIPFLKEKKEKNYLCSQCGKKYKFRYEFKAHLEFHAGKDKALCPICGKIFRRLQLRAHIERHSDFHPYSCKICDKTYKNQNGLKHHMMSHTGQIPYSCELCGRKFKERCYLKYHMRYHNSERNHECIICGKKFVRKASLQIHCRSHTQERPFSCKYCDKTFRTQTNCKYHQYYHEGIKPFSCSICHTLFRRPNTLRAHMKTHNKTKAV